MRNRFILLAPVLLFAFTGNARAAGCGGDFSTWLEGFRVEAKAAGISPGALNAALSGVTSDPQILALDRKQGYFK